MELRASRAVPLKPLVVYLDSNDYSELSNPRKGSPVRDAQRVELLRWARSKEVRFVYSAVHLSEMAPLDPAYSPAATARAEFLTELCGRNAFITFDALIEMELGRALNLDTTPCSPISDEGDWFPTIDDILPPVRLAATVLEEVDKLGKEHGLSRQRRRELKQKLFKGNKNPKAVTRQFMASAQIETDEILKRYPMRPKDAEIMARYVLGRATREDATVAFLNSLRDPQWIMRWFAQHHARLDSLITWFREPAKKMELRMKDLAARTKDLRRIAAVSGQELGPVDFLSARGWRRLQDDLLVSVATRLTEKFYSGHNNSLTPQIIDQYCPGFATAIRSLHSSLWTAVGTQPREPEDNDFIDAMHALYAPYTTLFRADRYMTAHVRKHATRYGVEIVSRLKDLPERIQAHLRSRNGQPSC